MGLQTGPPPVLLDVPFEVDAVLVAPGPVVLPPAEPEETVLLVEVVVPDPPVDDDVAFPPEPHATKSALHVIPTSHVCMCALGARRARGIQTRRDDAKRPVASC